MRLRDAAAKVVLSVGNAVVSASAALPNATPSTVEIDRSEGRGVIDRLVNLKIPDSLTEWLNPALDPLGFSIDHREAGVKPPRLYSVIKNSAGERAIFNIPKDILVDAEKWESVGNVLQVVRLRKQTIIAVSEGLENPHPSYQLVKKGWEEDWGLIWKFIGWEPLQTIRKSDMVEQMSLLTDFFELEDLLTKAREQQVIVKKITDVEVGKIAAIIAKVNDFIDEGERGWRLHLKQAGLEDLIGKLNLSGPAKFAAYGIIGQLQEYGPRDDYPQDSVLGRFLCQILTIADLSTDDQTTIRTIVKTFNLAPTFLKE